MVRQNGIWKYKPAITSDKYNEKGLALAPSNLAIFQPYFNWRSFFPPGPRNTTPTVVQINHGRHIPLPVEPTQHLEYELFICYKKYLFKFLKKFIVSFFTLQKLFLSLQRIKSVKTCDNSTQQADLHNLSPRRRQLARYSLAKPRTARMNKQKRF